MTTNASASIASPYLPVKGSAWRLAAADVNGDGKNEIIYSARDGAIRCANPDNGTLLWECPLGGFAYELRCADINGDGRPEFLAPCTDGMLYAISHRGELLWTFKAGLQLMDAVVAYPEKGKEPVIFCGGFDRQIYMLSADGKLISRTKSIENFVSRLAAGDLDGDGCDELVAIDRRMDMAIYKIRRTGLKLIHQQRLDSSNVNWENVRGVFQVFSICCADINGDGKAEIILGESLWSRQIVMVLNAKGERLWISKELDRSSAGYEYYSAAFVCPAGLRPERKGMETLVLTGADFRLFDAAGELVEQFGSPLGFTDLLVDGDRLWLGSSPNGDETIYRIDLSSDWKQTIQTLERQGVPKQIGDSIARLRTQVLAYRGSPPEGGPQYDLQLFNYDRIRKSVDTLSWFHETFGCYKNLKATGLLNLLENRTATGTDGLPFGGVHTDACAKSQEELVALIEQCEQHKVPVTISFAHGTRPQITLETAEALLKAGPNALNGFICSEVEEYPEMVRFYETYFGPLADLCAQYGNKRCITHNKGVWWMSMPTQEKMFDLLFQNNRKNVLTAGVEDSNSRTPEINLMSRLGLRQAGLIAHMESAVVLDLFTATRYHEWEYPRHGHPFFRLLAVQTLMGGDTFHLRINHLGKDGFTQDGRESTEIIFHMLGKGLLMAPQPEDMVGLSTLGIAVHDLPEKWIDEAHNGHNPDKWMDSADEDLKNAVIPHNGVTWGYTATPEHSIQSVLFNKTEQFGHIPATPYGPVAIVPVHADLRKVTGVKEWWHTDGIALWREGGPRLTGKTATDALKASFEKAAGNLPFRPFGDKVFFHTVRMDDNTWRIYAVDPGWLDPQDRQVDMHIQLAGNFKIHDLLTGEELPVAANRIRFTVPAGSLRILEASSPAN